MSTPIVRLPAVSWIRVRYTLWIDFSREFQTIGVCKICVSCGDGENDGVGFGDVLENHIPYLFLNVLWLITDWDLCEAGKIDEGECEDVGREDS